MRHRQEIDRRPLITMFLAVVWAIVATGRAAAEDPSPWKQISEHWYIFEIGGSRAGWMRDMVESDGANYRTTSETSMKIARMNDEASVYQFMQFIETGDGKPVSVNMTTRMPETVDTQLVFKESGIEQTVSRGGRTTTRSLAKLPGDWLPPHAVDVFSRQRREAKAKEFTFQTLAPLNGMEIITVSSAFKEHSRCTVEGREIPVSVWQTNTKFGQSMTIPSTEMYSSDDVLVYTETPMGLGNMVMRLASKESALAPLGKDIPELIVSAFVESSGSLPDIINTEQARYRLKAKHGPLPALPTCGAQRVTGEVDGVVTLIVDVNDNVAAPEADADDKNYRDSSTLIDSDDPFVQKLAERVLRPLADDPMLRADALREFVYEYITKKGMGTAFASAGETAKTRTGDCSEHAVLLAAMMRASNLPSRVATGLVYMTERNGKGVFGWHMWTQALIDGRWVDFDATLPVRYNAGHITTSVSSFSDMSSVSDLLPLFQLMGNLEIEIVDAEGAEAVEPAGSAQSRD